MKQAMQIHPNDTVAVALTDLTHGGNVIRSQTYSAFMPLIAVALIYLAIVSLLAAGVSALERRLRTNER